jgi:SAM-dependent MidA family methyltransferase
VHASPLFAAAVLTLLRAVDAGLGCPDDLQLVDVGAGRGELLLAVRDLVGAESADDRTALARRLRLTAVELSRAPAELPPQVGWSAELPEEVVGLVMANEWLDDVPVDVVELAADGPHRVLVEASTGRESPGGPVGLQDADWLARWWPLGGAQPGDRAEIGLGRDRAWAAAVAALRRGVAVAVDYGHLLADRAAGAHAAGTLSGYRSGRAVPPVPDGSCDITAHVAVDSCAAAGRAAGADETALLRQRTVLRALGLTGSLPSVDSAAHDAAGYAAALSRASQEAELLDPSGLGGFWWLAQSVGMPLPAPLTTPHPL